MKFPVKLSMSRTVLYFCLITLFVLAGIQPGYAQDKTVSLESLLSEMIDRDALAQYPDPYYTTRQFSSYDRDAQKPSTQSWFANWDRTQFIHVEENKGRKEYVMMDTEGPAAIVRFWMTFAAVGVERCGCILMANQNLRSKGPLSRC